MLLKISTTHTPATDLGYLLHKHPDRVQTTELSFGVATVAYPEANETGCTVPLFVDVDQADLVRGLVEAIERRRKDRFSLQPSSDREGTGTYYRRKIIWSWLPCAPTPRRARGPVQPEESEAYLYGTLLTMSRLEKLLEFAGEQRGFVTTANADSVGVPAVELRKMAARGVLERRGHGVYRIAAFAVRRWDELMEAVLWAGGGGVISHESALALWGLADVNPRVIHLTVPRRVRRAGGEIYRLWTDALEQRDVDEHEGIPATTPFRTIVDAARTGTDPRLIAQSIRTAERHDHISERDAKRLVELTRRSG